MMHSTSRPQKSQDLDPHVYEYVLRPVFWLLGLFIVSFWIFTIGKSDRIQKMPSSKEVPTGLEEKETSSSPNLDTSEPQQETGPQPQPEAGPEPGSPTPTPTPTSATKKQTLPLGITLWLLPYVTTGPRKAAAMLLYLAIMGAQLVEGYWIMVTMTRATRVVLRHWSVLFYSPKTSIWGFGAFTVGGVGSMLGIDALVLYFGFITLMFPYGCLLELARFDPGQARRDASEKEGRDVENGPDDSGREKGGRPSVEGESC